MTDIDVYDLAALATQTMPREASARKRSAPQPRREHNGDTFGTPELCAWSVGPGLFRFQTNSPEIARKLAKRSNAQLVAWGINCFLRIYQERMPRRQAISLVNRYLMSANSALFDRNWPPARRKTPRVSPQRRTNR